MYLESGDLWRDGVVQNYRAWKGEWRGVLSEEVAVMALKHDSNIFIYVSWNRDTEITVWRFFSVDLDGKEILVREEKKDGFETSSEVGVVMRVEKRGLGTESDSLLRLLMGRMRMGREKERC